MSSILVCRSLVFVVGGLLGFAVAKLIKVERATFARALAASIVCAALVAAWPRVEVSNYAVWWGGGMFLGAILITAGLMSTTVFRGLVTCAGVFAGLGLGRLGVALAEHVVRRGDLYTLLEGILGFDVLKG